MPCRITPHPLLQILPLNPPKMPKPSTALTLLPVNLMILLFKRFYLFLHLFLYSFRLICLWSRGCGDRTFVLFYLLPSLFSFYIHFGWFAYGHWDVVTKHLLCFKSMENFYWCLPRWTVFINIFGVELLQLLCLTGLGCYFDWQSRSKSFLLLD